MEENFTCGKWNLTQEEEDFQVLHGWWVQSLASVIVGIFGIIVNTISIVILSQKEMKRSFFNKLLICLTVFDVVFLVINVYESIRLHLIGRTDYCSLQGHVLIVLLPLRKIAMCCSIYMTLVLAFERYLAVARPIAHRNRSIGSSEGKRVLKCVSPVILLSILYCTPTFFEFKIQCFPTSNNHDTPSDALSDNSTTAVVDSEISSVCCIQPTDMRVSKGYILWYHNVANFVVTIGIPFLSLAFFNWKIYFIIKSAGKERENLEMRPQGLAKTQQKSEELRQASVLLGIVIAFLVCHVLRLILSLEEIITYEDWIQANKRGANCTGVQFWTMIAIDISHLLLQVNASINFFIYCYFSSQFRSALKEKKLQFAKLLCVDNI